MKILQLGKFYPIRGGVEKVMWDLTHGLRARGVDCDMLCAKLPQDPDGPVMTVKAWTKMAGTMIAPSMISRLRSCCRLYDVIHIHHPDPMAALSLRLSGYKGKVVLHWHSDIVSQKAFLRLYKPLQRWLVRRADAIVGTTPVYLESSEYLQDVQEKCRCIPIGITPFEVDGTEAGRLRKAFSGRFLLLAVGRLVPYKGYGYLLDAMALLPDDYHLFLVGDGPMRPQLEEQVRRLGLQERVTLAGYLEDGGEFRDLFGACDVFVLPSIMKTEAFGIVQIEAFSCGKPVVATTIPGSGVSWVNKDGVSGRNAEPRSAEALARAIREVCLEKEKYGSGALTLFRDRYRLDTMIDKTIQLYEEICK